MGNTKSHSRFVIQSTITDEEEWSNFIHQHPDRTAFHEAAFLGLMQSVKGGEAYAVIEREDTIRSAVIVTIQREKGIKAWMSTRAVIYAGPLFTERSDIKGFMLFLDEVIGRKVIFLEFRNFMDLSKHAITFTENGYEYLPYLNFVLGLENTTMEQLIARMNYNRRREIRLSYEQGATVTEAKGEEEIQSGYAILKDLYATRVKLPLPECSFFLEMVQRGIGRVFVVKHQEQIIGASFCLFNQQGLFTWYYCGKRDYHKKIFPTHLAILGAIEFALQHGIQSLDFMGAGMSGTEYGVRKYKEEFGGTLVEFGRYRKVYSRWRYRMGVWAIQQIQKMKRS